MRFLSKYSLFLFSFAFFSIIALQPQASAASNVDFIISPIKEVEQSSGYYRDEVIGGETKKYTFYVENLIKEPIDLWIYPADATPMVNGGKSFTLKGEKNTSVGSWISPSKEEMVHLKPLEKKKFVYTVKVPKDLKPGEYVGGIVAEQIPKEDTKALEASQNQAVLLIERIPRIGVQIVMEKKKELAIQDMSIDDFKHSYISNGYSQLTVKLANTGTILQRPNGVIVIRDAKGNGIYSKAYDAGASEKSMYAGKTADMVYYVEDQILWPGEYSAYFEANFNDKKVSRTFNFTITEADAQKAQESLSNAGLLQGRGFMDWLRNHPWMIYAGSGLLLLIFGSFIFLLILLLKRKKREQEEEKARQRVARQAARRSTRHPQQ
ncbi:WxL protein peptidoglycan domain-containing protein [Paenibacillus sp. FSL R7-0026]|uniref:WxL protein peptidoglycan domain-containing protein n=1 Tax=Paenibacillus sp. FSL R7-0026 TaxID=2921668 RepID=UPI0030F80503